jgi:PAS domain S-box-containing protein
MSSPPPESWSFALRLARRLRLAHWSPWPLVAFGLIVIGLGLGLDLRRQYLESAAHERERLAAAADAVAHGVGQRLVAASMLLARLDAALHANPTDANAIVHSVSGLESHLIAVLAIDADGRVVASSRAELAGIDLSGDEVVWSARADADVEPRLYLRTPPPALSGSGHLAARARRDGNGAFAGIAAVIVAPEYFEAALVPLGGTGAAIEIRDGSAMIALRWQEADDPADAGVMLAEATVNPTLIAIDRPWSVRVTRSEAAVFAAWSRQARFGVLLWLLVAGVALVAGIIGALRRNEVRRLRGLHQRLLQGVDEGLAGIDADGRVRFANAAFAKYLATTPGELLGRDLRELLDWPEAQAGSADPVCAVIGGELPRFEGPCRLGTTTLRATITPTRDGGIVSGALLAFADPLSAGDAGAARSPADRLYRTLFDLSPDGVLIVDLDSERPLAFNPAATRLLGYASEEFGRLRVREHEANPSPLDTIRHITRVLAEGRGEFETRYRTAQGDILDVQVLAQTIEFAGRPALYWIVRDITERKRAATELKASAKLAERANRARSEFLANMSHEIRTPMTAILGLTYLLQKTELSAIQRDHAQKIDSAARTLLAILDDLLDYSKLEAGRIAIERRPFVLRELLEEIAIVFASAARDKGLAFEITTAANTPTALLGDAVRLRQVMLNLVGNAIKFTERGRVDVEVDGRSVDAGEQSVDAGEVDLLIAVRDTGIGIDAAQLQRVFEPFYQAETSSTRRFGGTGLGLPITQWLINLMGGTLDIESTPGVGSVFRVRLRLTRVVVDEQPAQLSGPPHPAFGPRLTGLSVLLVEDHPINRQVAREILVGEGAAVEVASDGHEAISRLESDPKQFDVVLMDIQMPRMDGFEATGMIREKLGLTRLPVIAMTANASPEDRAQSRAAGMDDHLAKPIDVHSLVATVLRHARPGSPPLALAATPIDTQSPGGEPPVLALEQALARLAGHRALYAQMARLFAQEQGESVRCLREALAQGDRIEAARAAHTLKGVAATLGAEALSAIAAQFERALKRHSEPDELERMSDRLGEALAQAIAALERAAEQLAPAADEVVPDNEFDRSVFEDRLDALVLALVDSNMAALDHFAELRAMATTRLIAPLRVVDDALGRLDFRSALDACRRVEAALDTPGEPAEETHE